MKNHKQRQKKTLSKANSMSSLHNKMDTSQNSRHSQGHIAKEKTAAVTCTVPVTPSFMKRKAALVSQQLVSTEEMEMQKIKQLRQELAAKRKIADNSKQKALTSSGYHPIKSKNSLTKPDTFHFATDERIKTHPENTGNDLHSEEFPRMLRSHNAVKGNDNKPKLPTIPQPFALHEKKRKRTETQQKESKFLSMAQRVHAFSSKTPDRFRTKPSGKEAEQLHTSNPCDLKPTIPKTPHFETRTRKRAVLVQSQAELDEKEVEEIKRYKFKANPVNDKIFKNPNLGVKKHPSKQPTKPEGFHLETEKRTEVWESHKDQGETPYEFHARPVPSKILEKPVGVKPVKGLPLTRPESPAFALKHRLRPRSNEHISHQEDENKCVRAHPVPHQGIPFQPQLEHKVTEPQPFSFEARDSSVERRKKEKIMQIYEEERKAREFKAQPLPNLSSPDFVARKQERMMTVPEPFNLEADARGARKAQEWVQKMEEELKQQRAAAAAFKAKPTTVLHKEPFIPKKSNKPLTDINDVQLSTERRAEERAEWESWKDEQERQAAAERASREQERLEQEKREIEKMRQDVVHKPEPVRKYKTVHVRPSDKPLTKPQTPRFSDRLQRNVRV